MNKKITKLMAALALLLFMTPAMVGWGQTTGEASLTWSDLNLANQTSVDGTAYNLGDYFTVTCTKNNASTAPTYYTSGTAVRCYATKSTNNGNIITVAKKASVTGNVYITKVEYNGTHSKKGTTSFTYSGSPSSTTETSASYNQNDEVTSASATLCETGGSANGQFYSTSVRVEYILIGDAPTPTSYTVTYNAGDGTGTMSDPNSPYTAGATVTLLTNSFTAPAGYEWSSWDVKDASNNTVTVSNNQFTMPASDVTVTAQYTQSGGSGTATATLTQSNLELTGSYTTNTSKTIDGITYVYTDLMKSTTRIQAKANTGTIRNTTPYPGDITSVVITHEDTGRATTINGSADGTNWTQVATGSGSITADFSGRGYKYFQITRGSNAAYWSGIDITYSTSASSQSQSDLAITDASTDLTFDLYNNATAQVINYTTSSTGAITITPASPTAYFSYVHDATAKTITVTPLAVTPSAQTVTISQEADENYYPGTTTFTVSVVNSDPNAPGTQNNPYTVAQARAAIDAGTGTQGVYATGIVCTASPQLYNNKYLSYYISDDGTETTRLEAYNGLGLNQANFTSVDDVEVGATVVIYGNLTKYNDTYEFAANNYLVSYTAPVHAVAAPTFSPAAGTYTEAQNVTISCTTTGATIYYTLDGTEPTSASTQYTSALAISSTTTVKAIAYVGTEASTVATATYHFCSATDPYTVTEALSFNEYPANGIYVTGVVSTAPTAAPTNNGELTYYISVDGQASNQLEVFKGKGLNQAAFTAQGDIQVGDIVTVYGNVVIYGTTNPIKEFAQGNYLVSFERPTQQYTLTVTPSANVEIYTFVGDDPTQEGQAGAFTTQVYGGTTVGISVSADEGYILSLIVDGTDVTSQLDETGWYEFTMPAHDVIVTATASLAPVVTTNTYTLATSIESGKQYIIVGKGNSKYYAMSYDKGTNRYAVEITSDGTTATVAIDNTQTNAHEFTITSLATTGYYSIQDATASGYLYAGSDSGNQLKTYDESDLDVNGEWHITINAETGVASVVADQSSNRNVMQFNAGSSSNNNQLFNCYASASQHDVYLYVKDEPRTYTKSIAGWDTAEEGASNFYLIASPIGNVNPTNVTIQGVEDANMVSGHYDLYYFDHTQAKEWVNYKATDGTPGAFSLLESGKGYLYANKDDVTLVFTGTGLTSGTKTIDLDYVSGMGIDLPGWNLLGNPFAENAYLVSGNSYRSFYTMDVYGNYLSVTGKAINAMEGIFVKAEGTGESVTFTTTALGSKSSTLALNLSNGRNLIDRAIVRFDGGDQLPKLQFRQGSTKVYIPVEGQDYAVVSCEEMGELPVSFKAEENGSYNLSLSTEEVSFAYLHLIDNLTGADVDLLQTPSYSFEAKTTDYSQRFKLVIATGDNSNSDNFAFFSNGSFVINNDGAATLQVIDVTGRIVKSESINGCANVNVNAAPGVYMLRLINGDNVKVQKVVVR